MNAPGIPNLLSLRSSRGGRAASRRYGHEPNANTTTSERHDRIIQQTDDDAAGSRLSAVDTGHLEDAFADVFWDAEGDAEGGGKAGARSRPRRMPIINRGTYVRTTILDKLVLDFINQHAGLDTPLPTSLSTKSTQAAQANSPPSPSTPTQIKLSPQVLSQPPTRQKIQIISIGAGTDTRFFRLLQHHPHLAEQLIYHELDFSATTLKKIQAIERHPFVKDLLLTAASRATSTGKASDVGRQSRSNEDFGETSIRISHDSTTLTSPLYNVHAVDLRDFGQLSPSIDSPPPAIPNLDTEAPTLLLSECCLTYLPAATSTDLLTYFATALIPRPAPLAVVMYEPLHPHDVFGKTMRANLASRGISMPGVDAFPDLEAHGKRLREVLAARRSGDEGATGKDGERGQRNADVGFEGWTIKDVWDLMVSWEEKERLRRCEMVDEEEEWVLLAGHYGVVRGWRS